MESEAKKLLLSPISSGSSWKSTFRGARWTRLNIIHWSSTFCQVRFSLHSAIYGAETTSENVILLTFDFSSVLSSVLVKCCSPPSTLAWSQTSLWALRLTACTRPDLRAWKSGRMTSNRDRESLEELMMEYGSDGGRTPGDGGLQTSLLK